MQRTVHPKQDTALHFAVVPHGLQDDPEVTHMADIGVYSALRRFADFKTGKSAFPSVATIARLARCSERTAQYSLARLEAAGWISMTRRGGMGRKDTNTYQVYAQKTRPTATIPLEKAARPAPFSTGKAASHAPFNRERVHHMHEKGAPHAPELEPIPRDTHSAQISSSEGGGKELREILGELRRLHKEKTGATYVVVDRDGVGVKRLIKALGAPVVREKLAAYYHEDFWFTRDGCYSLGGFEKHVNEITGNGQAGAESREEAAAAMFGRS